MKKQLVQNFTYLFFIKILLLVLPLVTFPYLLNTIKSEKYGIVMWLWAIADIFILCIRFGFDTFCVKLVSISRNKLNKLSKIFTTVIVLKLTIFSLSLVVLFFLYYCNQAISENLSLFLFFIIYIFFESMLPIW
ncbi:MAG: oligosaccharide flippase family protein, partial [Campylobacter sp.]|nr:oligosaccharide flippase family protein [Campylobacter sp.]